MDVYRIPKWVETPYDLELYHHGIMGQRKGKRRWQNQDGSLTPAGRIRYGVGQAREKVGDMEARVSSRVQTSGFDTSERRASSLGETGTGVRTRSRIGVHSTLNVNDDLSSIKPALKMKGKEHCDNLSDSSIDELRVRETKQIGRYYMENSYANSSLRPVNVSPQSGARSSARYGLSVTGGESGHYFSKGDVREKMINRAEQDRAYNYHGLREDFKREGRKISEYKNDPLYKVGKEEIERDFDWDANRAYDEWTDPKDKRRSKKW